MVQNKSFVFKKVPQGWPVPGQDLAIENRDFDLNQEPPDGGLTVKNIYASFDPYQRGRMRDPKIKSYAPPFELGAPITNRCIFQVVKSRAADFQPGDVLLTTSVTPIQEYSLFDADTTATARKLLNPHNLDLVHFVGALGMPGLTAWSSLYEIGKPKAGETMFVSAASGAVGQLVGQLAKREGLRVVGSVGDDKKLDFITKELGFDDGFNYKKEKVADALPRVAPNGVDIYFENVGGETLEAALENMNWWGRIIACGMISQYNALPDERYPVRNLMQIVAKRLTMRGFIVGDADMGPKHAAEHQEKLQQWLAEGSVKAKVSVTEGMDNAIDGFLGMLKGENFGKAVLKIADLD